MDKLVTKLDGLLKRLYPGAGVELECDFPGAEVGGFVVWKGFKGIDIERRLQELHRALLPELNKKELRRVSLIMPLTPREMAFRREEMALEAKVDGDLAGQTKHG